MTRLRKMMLEELQRRNYSESTARAYVRVIRDFAAYFHKAPDKLGPEHVRQFQAYLFRERKLEPGTVLQYSAGLRFFFVKTLHRHFMVDNIPLPKEPELRKKPVRALRGMLFERIFVVQTSKDRTGANAQPSRDHMSIG